MSDTLSSLLEAIPDLATFHAPTSAVYRFAAAAADEAAHRAFGEHTSCQADLQPFGQLLFPYRRMGAIDSVDLFGLDELIIFAFYWRNRSRYARAADIGANVGLHSILLSRCGYETHAYEPDPRHVEWLRENLSANGATAVTVFESAVSSLAGNHQFIRVLGNTTSGHLAGSKAAVYGETQRFDVSTMPIKPIMQWADLVKVDAEGHEREILLATDQSDWANTDMLLEVGSADNASAIFEHASRIRLRLFAQRLGWRRVQALDEMPTSYRDGTLFASATRTAVW